MKRSLLVGMMAVAGVLGLSAAPAAAQAPKVAYINSQKIVAQAPGTTEAQQTLQTEMQRYQTELQRLETQLDSLQSSFEKQQTTLSATAKQQRQQELQQRFTAYQQRRAELEQTAQRRQQELVAPIMKRISEVIEQMRKDGGYAMIFDAAQGGLITADPALDLTDRVLERLRTAPAARPGN